MDNTNEDLTSFEVAKLAKEKGYPQSIDKKIVGPDDAFHPSGLDWGYSSNMDEYNDHVKKITWAQLRRWLQTEQGIIVWVTPYSFSSAGGWAWNIQKWDNGNMKVELYDQADVIDHTFDEAFDRGLQQALTYIDNG